MNNNEIIETFLKKEIQKEINQATAHLKGSILDEDGMDADRKLIIDAVTMKVQA